MFETKADLFAAHLQRLAELSKALSHPARLAILEMLSERETCICGELVDDLPLAQASISRHLKVLKDANLVKGEIVGPRSCYCLNKDALEALHVEVETLFAKLLSAPPCDDCC